MGLSAKPFNDAKDAVTSFVVPFRRFLVRRLLRTRFSDARSVETCRAFATATWSSFAETWSTASAPMASSKTVSAKRTDPQMSRRPLRPLARCFPTPRDQARV